MGKNPHILSVGFNFFPVGQAQVQRQLLIAKALIMKGFDVTVLCRYGDHRPGENVELEGEYEGINYIYCSRTTVRPDNILIRNFLKFKGLINEIKAYYRFSKKHNLKGAIVSTNRFYNIIFYYLMGKILNITTVVDNVEYWTSIKNIKGWKRFDKMLYDKFYFHFTDRIICISDFLIGKIGNHNRDSTIKIPAITDFEKFDIKSGRKLVEEKYFLYCGSMAYFDVMTFIINSFNRINLDNVFLVLVTNKPERIIQYKNKTAKHDLIKILTNLKYEDLINLYKNSEGLLIPLRNNIQDQARFPHKIGEYCASGKPVITNWVGEIKNYFNTTNAFICDGFDENQFADAMIEVITDPVRADLIGKKGYELGLEVFNYKSYAGILAELYPD
jgi:glycosyltransferase involved in cell wall biosynthesis